MIKIENLNKSFKQKGSTLHVLKNLSLDIPDYGFTIIIGKSGSGKTTFLNALGGLETYQGSITYKDGHKETGKLSATFDEYRSKHIGYIYQNFLIFGEETVEENVRKSLIIAQILDYEEQRKRIRASLKAVSMWLFRRRKASELSLGQKQRVSIARALAINPDLLLADEPTGNLDSENAKNIMEILKALSLKIPVVCVTHNDYLAYNYGDNFFFMKDGILEPIDREKLQVADEVRTAFHRKKEKNVLTKSEKKTYKVVMESFKVLLIDGVKKLIVPPSYEAITEETEKSFVSELDTANEKNEIKQENIQDTLIFDNSQFKNIYSKKNYVLFSKRKHKGRIFKAIISFFTAILVTFILNIGYVMDGTINEYKGTLDKNSVGYLMNKEDKSSDKDSFDISPLQKAKLVDNPNSFVTGFLDDSLSLSLNEIVLEAFNYPYKVNRNNYYFGNVKPFFLSKDMVLDSFSLRGEKISNLKENEVYVEDSLLENFAYVSNLGSNKNNYIGTYVSIDGTLNPKSLYTIKGFIHTNLSEGCFIFGCDTKTIYQGIYSYNTLIKKSTNIFDGVNFVFDKNFNYVNKESVEKVTTFFSDDLDDALQSYDNVSLPLNNDSYNQSYFDKIAIYSSVLDKNSPYFTDEGLKIKKNSKKTIFIVGASREEISNNNINLPILDILLNPTFKFDSNKFSNDYFSKNRKEANYSSYYYYNQGIYGIEFGTTDDYKNLTITKLDNGEKEGLGYYIREDLIDLIPIINQTTYIYGLNPICLGTFKALENAPLILLNNKEIKKLFFSNSNFGVLEEERTSNTRYLTKNMEQSKKYFDSLENTTALNDAEYGEIFRSNQARYFTLIILAVVLIFLILYAIIFRSDVILDSEKIGIYRCLGVKNSKILAYYSKQILLNISLRFGIPYILFTLIVVSTYIYFAPIWLLVFLPLFIYVFALFFSLLPLFTTLQKDPRLLAKENIA